MPTQPSSSAADGAPSAETQEWGGERVRRVLTVGLIVLVVVQSVYIAPDLLAALRDGAEAVPGARTAKLLMHGSSILGSVGLIAQPTLPFTQRHTRLRSWVSSMLIIASIVLGSMYLMR